jgi:hypothetical protein
MDKTIRERYMKLQQSGCLCAAKRTGRPGPSAEMIMCKKHLSGARYVSKGGHIEHL